MVEYWYSVLQQVSKAYLSCLTETLCLLISNSSLPTPPQPQVITILVFNSMNLITLDTSYKGTHEVFVFLWLVYFT